MLCVICEEEVIYTLSCNDDVVCVDCYLNWFKSINSIKNLCPICKKEIDYCKLRDLLIKSNKLNEFINIKKEQLFNFYKHNIDTIDITPYADELFNDTCKMLLEKLKDFCCHNKSCNIIQFEYNTLNTYYKETSLIHTYYNSINEFKKYLDNTTKHLTDIINDYTELYEKNKIKKIHNKIISSKRKLLNLAMKNIYEARYNTKIKINSSNHCPLSNCYGIIINNKCNMCNNLICTKCNSLMNTHTLYNVDDDIKYIQNEINISKNINDGRITELTNELSKLKSMNNYDELGYVSFISDEEIINELKLSSPSYITCNRDNFETNKLLHNNCKKCPCCHNYIYKINGCNHMHCTFCNTSFNWDDLTLINDIYIDNPHLSTHYNFQEIKCDIIDYNDITDIFNSYLINNKNNIELNNKISKIQYFYSLFLDILDFLNEHNINNLNNEITDNIIKYKLYLLDHNDTEDIKQKLIDNLYNIYHKSHSLIILNEHYQTLAQIINDILLSFISVSRQYKNKLTELNDISLDNYINQLENAKSYITDIILNKIKILDINNIKLEDIILMM